MPSEKSIDQKFSELHSLLQFKDKSEIKMDAHGGFTILFVYHPSVETDYLSRVKAELQDAHFIDIAKLFVECIDSDGYEDFLDMYKEYSTEPEKLFKSESSELDLFQMILSEVEKAGQQNKLPVIIRAGALFGTGIENINIMDSKEVQDLPLPLVIMYPGTKDQNDKLLFLNTKMASDYRATLIF